MEERIKDVLITDYVHPELLSGLSNMGFTFTYAPEMSREEMVIHIVHYTGVVINTRCSIDRKVINHSPRLRWIARLGSGLDIIDLEAAAEKKINVISAPEGNAEAVAEHAMAMLLCLSNNLLSADRQVRDGLWMREQNRGWEIAGKTIGIIGYGNNGSAFARLWKGWDVSVLAYDKYLDNYGGEHVRAVDRETLLRESDIISLHIPLTKETLSMVNQEFISKCKHGCVIINTSRGMITELNAILSGLKSGHLKGACLDVLPYEPPGRGDMDFLKVFEELKMLPNVVLTPHIAGWTVESKKKIAEVLADKIKRAIGI
jgi:D-3-phosphoglycerate dehydrogenase